MALTPWIRIGQPLEAVMSDYERIFDAWNKAASAALSLAAWSLPMSKASVPYLRSRRSRALPKARPQSPTARRAPATRQGKAPARYAGRRQKGAAGP